MNLFIKKHLSIFFTLISLPCLMIYLKTDYDYGLSPYESILKYKTNKINNKESQIFWFFADSSCGNGIDASYFGDNGKFEPCKKL